MEDYNFSLELEVRDYECDTQGIVNNAVYQNYLEHTRHQYLKQVGVDFNEYTRKGIKLVVVRVELDYKSPLSGGDRFLVGLKLQRESRIRFTFYQDIYRLPDNKPILKGKIIGTALDPAGRPYMPKEIGNILDAV